MTFFGMYNSNYIGGANFMGCGLYGGMHPSFMQSAPINYFTGTVTQPLGYPMYPQTPVVQPQTNPVDTYIPQNLQQLETTLNNAKNEQGVVGKFLDGIKGATGIGVSSKKCQAYIDKAKTGQINPQEAYNMINNYIYKQKAGVNMLSGIASGALSVAAVGLSVPTGGLSLAALATAAGVGAGSKAMIKTLDRATNNIDGDALDFKQIVRDGASGALNGTVSAATAGMGTKAIGAATSAKEAAKQLAISGAKAGAISGAVMGAGDYVIDCTFDENQHFDGDRLVTNTAYGAIAGGLTGAAAGGISGYTKFNNGGNPPSNPPSGNNGGGGNNNGGIPAPMGGNSAQSQGAPAPSASTQGAGQGSQGIPAPSAPSQGAAQGAQGVPAPIGGNQPQVQGTPVPQAPAQGATQGVPALPMPSQSQGQSMVPVSSGANSAQTASCASNSAARPSVIYLGDGSSKNALPNVIELPDTHSNLGVIELPDNLAGSGVIDLLDVQGGEKVIALPPAQDGILSPSSSSSSPVIDVPFEDITPVIEPQTGVHNVISENVARIYENHSSSKLKPDTSAFSENTARVIGGQKAKHKSILSFLFGSKE